METDRKYNGVIYIRLSKDDGCKKESNSVSNQRELIYAFLKKNPDIQLIAEKVDDGYSGINYERPAFQEMIDLVKNGKVNCIIVKDLSRFGRDYIETGRYIEKLFPLLSVRFIAINDSYDSLKNQSITDSLLIPFKNLINDSYSRDISTKVRSSLLVRQKKGEHTGSFPLYGYAKSKDNHKKLIIDDYAVDVVRDIFKMRIKGYSTGKIADVLNQQGILSPYEYKQALGYSYKNPFKVHKTAQWSASTIERILKNEMYTGVMVQGRSGRINYKLKKRITKPEEEWIRVEGTHPAIISKDSFSLVEAIAKLDTRRSERRDMVYPFSGLLYCGNCMNTMVRKTVKSSTKDYVYYICSTYKADKYQCTSHRISELSLNKTVLAVLNTLINLIVKAEEMLIFYENMPMNDSQYIKVYRRIVFQENELEKYKKLIAGLYEDVKDGIITKTDYYDMKDAFEVRSSQIQKQLRDLQNQADDIIKSKGKSKRIKEFIENKNITEITRALIVLLIERIIIVNKKKIIINFRFEDTFKL